MLGKSITNIDWHFMPRLAIDFEYINLLCFINYLFLFICISLFLLINTIVNLF